MLLLAVIFLIFSVIFFFCSFLKDLRVVLGSSVYFRPDRRLCDCMNIFLPHIDWCIDVLVSLELLVASQASHIEVNVTCTLYIKFHVPLVFHMWHKPLLSSMIHQLYVIYYIPHVYYIYISFLYQVHLVYFFKHGIPKNMNTFKYL